MLDLVEGVLEIFAEAARLGRRRSHDYREWGSARWQGDVGSPLLERLSPTPPESGVFLIADPYGGRHGGSAEYIITRAPAATIRSTCARCGCVVEQREGLTVDQAVHIGARYGRCPSRKGALRSRVGGSP